jgi:hypothetical protein
VPAERRPDDVDDRHRAQPHHEGQRLDGDDAEREVDAEHGTQRGAGRHPEDIGGHERVAEQALVGGAGGGQRASDQDGGGDARTAHVDDDRVDRRRKVVGNAGQLRPQHGDELAGGDGEASDREGDRDENHERATGQREAQVLARPCRAQDLAPSRLSSCRSSGTRW